MDATGEAQASDVAVSGDASESLRESICSTRTRHALTHQRRGRWYQIGAILVFAFDVLMLIALAAMVLFGFLTLQDGLEIVPAMTAIGLSLTGTLALIKLSSSQFELSERAETDAAIVRYADEKTLIEVVKNLR